MDGDVEDKESKEGTEADAEQSKVYRDLRRRNERRAKGRKGIEHDIQVGRRQPDLLRQVSRHHSTDRSSDR